MFFLSLAREYLGPSKASNSSFFLDTEPSPPYKQISKMNVLTVSDSCTTLAVFVSSQIYKRLAASPPLPLAVLTLPSFTHAGPLRRCLPEFLPLSPDKLPTLPASLDSSLLSSMLRASSLHQPTHQPPSLRSLPNYLLSSEKSRDKSKSVYNNKHHQKQNVEGFDNYFSSPTLRLI